MAGVAVLMGTATLPGFALAPPAGATGDSGAGETGARIVGRGDLMSWILGRRSGPSRGGGKGSNRAPQCWWRTVADTELAWLVAAAAYSADEADPHPLRTRVLEMLEAQRVSGGDLQVRRCDGVLDDFRVVPGAGDPLLRSGRHLLVTTLPLPEPTISPPPHVAVPLGEPVFVSFDEQRWLPVSGTLDADGLRVQVRADPIRTRIFSGEGSGTLIDCDGPGVAFDPSSSASPTRQAAEPGRCTYRYSTLSQPGDPWLGYVTVFWRAEWRGVDGAWRPLGTVARTVITQRATRSVRTQLERR